MTEIVLYHLHRFIAHAETPYLLKENAVAAYMGCYTHWCAKAVPMHERCENASELATHLVKAGAWPDIDSADRDGPVQSIWPSPLG